MVARVVVEKGRRASGGGAGSGAAQTAKVSVRSRMRARVLARRTDSPYIQRKPRRPPRGVLDRLTEEEHRKDSAETGRERLRPVLPGWSRASEDE